MKLHAKPLRFRIHCLPVLFLIPLVLVQPWLRGIGDFEAHGLFFSVLLVLTYLLLVQLREVALYLLSSIATYWTISSSIQAVQNASFVLGVYSLVFGYAAFFCVYLLYREFRRPYLNPRVEWYQGLPRAMGKVRAEIGDEEFRVAGIDEVGLLAFGEREHAWTAKRLSLTLSYAGKKVELSAFPLFSTRKGRLFSLYFADSGIDEKMGLSQLLRSIERSGYDAT